MGAMSTFALAAFLVSLCVGFSYIAQLVIDFKVIRWYNKKKKERLWKY